MVIKKLLKLNNDKSVGVGIPAKLARELDLDKDSYVNISVVGNTLHMTKVVIA